MREIKFKIFDKKNKKILEIDTLFINEGMFKPVGDDEYSVWNYDTEYYSKPMQYTGLKIKDKEIYEGDIIKARNDYSYKVVFENGSFVLYHLNKYADVDMVRWGLLGRLFDSDMKDILDKCEVIGNIYENPELLQGI